MSESTLEQLDQQITLNLQKIDTNLSYCFNKITKEIIPNVSHYGNLCDEVIHSSNWLKEMFQQSSNVQLTIEESSHTDGKKDIPETIFPMKLRKQVEDSSSVMSPPKIINKDINDAENTSQQFHTANITTTGQVLKVPESSDEDDQNDGSTLQKQRKKRKASLLLQQKFGSSSTISSTISSPINISKRQQENCEVNVPLSSPGRSNVKNNVHQEESTNELIKSETVIHFPTKKYSS